MMAVHPNSSLMKSKNPIGWTLKCGGEQPASDGLTLIYLGWGKKQLIPSIFRGAEIFTVNYWEHDINYGGPEKTLPVEQVEHY